MKNFFLISFYLILIVVVFRQLTIPQSLTQDFQVSGPIETSAPSVTPFFTPSQLVLVPNVPYVPQAPFNDWKDPRQQDACEETSALIAVYWAQKKPLTKQIALDIIIDLAKYQTDKFGGYHDTSAADTVDRIIKGYFGYHSARVLNNATLADIIQNLQLNNLVIVPANGRALNNPNFTQPGPERHNLVIKGYDPVKQEFITNDPGTWRGESYRYPQSVLYNAIRDYPTGDHLPIPGTPKNIIIISKS